MTRFSACGNACCFFFAVWLFFFEGNQCPGGFQLWLEGVGVSLGRGLEGYLAEPRHARIRGICRAARGVAATACSVPCFSPLKGYRSRSKNASGRFSIVFNPKFGYIDMPLEVACGQCIGCRLERARQWGVRGMHEAKSHDVNSYLTLTYEDAFLPDGCSLQPKELQKFWKRLRRRIEPTKIKYMACGEYGEELDRPHYHACLFGYRPDDLTFWKKSKGHDLYRSPFLEKVWGKGMVFVGDVSFQTARYVGGYVLKKINGAMADEHYKRVDVETGEILWITPEFITCSHNLGRDWYDTYHSDWYRDGSCVVDGHKVKTPKYYDRRYEVENPEDFERIRELRRRNAQERKADNTPRRLKDREAVKKAEMKIYGHK